MVARQFSRVAWPAFGVLVLTGIWNVAAESDHGPRPLPGHADRQDRRDAAVGVAALLHARARRPAALAVWGAVTGVTALAAVFLGVLLAG